MRGLLSILARPLPDLDFGQTTPSGGLAAEALDGNPEGSRNTKAEQPSTPKHGGPKP